MPAVRDFVLTFNRAALKAKQRKVWVVRWGSKPREQVSAQSVLVLVPTQTTLLQHLGAIVGTAAGYRDGTRLVLSSQPLKLKRVF